MTTIGATEPSEGRDAPSLRREPPFGIAVDHRTLLDAAPDAMVVVDDVGVIVHANSETERMFAWSRDELVGQKVEVLVPEGLQSVHPAHRAAFMDDPKVRQMGIDLDLDGLRRDGTTFPVEVGLAPLPTPSGLMVVAAVRDATLRRRERVRIAELTEQLERSNAELEQFTYAVSHDLQEPLRSITGFLGLLKKKHSEKLEGEAHHYIEVAVEGAERLHTLIADLLTYSRAGRAEPATEPVDAEVVAQEVIEDLRVSIDESSASIEIGPLPQVLVDAKQLHQVLQNLVGNAIKFSEEDKPPVVRVRGTVEGDRAMFEVEDEGIGIKPEHQARIFEVFQRLHARTEYAGTGIGLALVRRIVERHGGHIEVESDEAQGAVFRFDLPAAYRA